MRRAPFPLGIACVTAAYWATAFVVPTMAKALVTDDWFYTKSAEVLVHDHRLTVHPIAAASSVLHVAWGGLFAEVMGMSFGALRVSTVALHGVGGIAMYLLLQQLGIGRQAATAGAVIYLFSPMAFVLSFSFMTDVPFMALLTASALFYVRGVTDQKRSAILLGSLAAALALLIRHHGILIPIAYATLLLFDRRTRLKERVVRLLLGISVPMLVVAGYFLWAKDQGLISELAGSQQDFAKSILGATPSAAVNLVPRLTFVALIYLGLFLAPALILRVRALTDLKGLKVRKLVWSGLVAAFLVAGFTTFWRGAKLPLVPSFIAKAGLGADNLAVGRPPLVGDGFLSGAAIVCGVFTLLISIAVATRQTARSGGSSMRFLAILFGWQAVAVLALSFQFPQDVTLARYFLPLMPLGIAMFLAATRDRRPAVIPFYATIVFIALFSVMGTRDFLTSQELAWRLADDAVQDGINPSDMEGGAEWDGYNLFDYSRSIGLKTGLDGDFRIPAEIMAKLPSGLWWIPFWAPAQSSQYVVAAGEIQGFQVVRKVELSQWLNPDPTYMYLLHWAGADPLTPEL